jgi:hypothetical protein
MANAWTDFSDIDVSKIVLKPGVKAQGSMTPNAYISWINLGLGPLRFKLPPGSVGYPTQPPVSGQGQAVNYQLDRQNEYSKPDGSVSLLGEAQRNLVKKITEIEDTLLELVAKDPGMYHNKFPVDKDVNYFKKLLVPTIKESADPKYPNVMKLKLMPHKETQDHFQGRNQGKETEVLIVEDAAKSAMSVTKDTVAQIFQRGTQLLPVIQAVNMRFLTNKITITWRLVYAFVKMRDTPRVKQGSSELPTLGVQDFYDAEFYNNVKDHVDHEDGPDDDLSD